MVVHGLAAIGCVGGVRTTSARYVTCSIADVEAAPDYVLFIVFCGLFLTAAGIVFLCFDIFDLEKAKGNGRRDEDESMYPANASR